MQAQEAIGGLILLSSEERKGRNDYSIDQCEARIQELLQVIKNPPKDRQVANVLGQLTLLYQRRVILERDQCVNLQFMLNNTLQTADATRCELLEVEEKLEAVELRARRLEVAERSQATPPSPEDWGVEINPVSQVETFEGEPHVQHPERTFHSELENVEAALQRFPSQARGFSHTSTESRTGMSRQITFSGAVSHPTVGDSHEQYLAVDSLEVNSSRFRGEQHSNFTRSTLLYDSSPPPRQQESRLCDSGGSYRPQPLHRT
ncbi:hypothetical protein AMECASPLE_036036 [Ameca splendens]|uniref:Uncharacterized protein n=1 Tax=Ameca splendens TaxID=208324 RepID=A0ABV0YUM9_9TELE